MATSHISLASTLRQPSKFRHLPLGFMSPMDRIGDDALFGGETADQAFLRGVDEGRNLAEITHLVERKALLDLLASAEAFHHVSGGDVAGLIATAVERLVTQIVGDMVVDADWLHAQIVLAAAVVADAERDCVVCLNPLDAALLADSPIALPLRADADVRRGDVRIETGTGWVEAGRSVYLDALNAALAGKDAAA